MSKSFWQRPLHTLSDTEWERLCDRCGRCCHEKYEDEESGEIYSTNIACVLFDDARCRCKDYANRWQRVPQCLDVRQMDRRDYAWLPETCAYRLRAAGYPLPDWHPLVSGDPESVHRAGISMRGCSVYPVIQHGVAEERVSVEDMLAHSMEESYG